MEKNRIQLSDSFTYGRLIRFVAAPVLMMICTSLYSIVDGIFVSNFAGKTPFAAVNLIMPVCMGAGTVGMMFGTGGSAVVSYTLGEGKKDKANRWFSLIVWSSVCISLVITVLSLIFMRNIASALGAEGELLEDAVIYGRILSLALVAFVLQNVFQSFFVTAEKPDLSLKITLAAGLTNFVLDWLFIAVFKWGIVGAALATGAGQIIGGFIPLIYFLKKNDSLLRIVKTSYNGRVILKTCTNGSSEMVTNLATSFVSILYNFQLMKIAGEDGIAAYGIIMYVNFVFTAIYFGYAMGSAPIAGYHYGAANHKELKSLFGKSLMLMSVAGVILTASAEVLNVPVVKIFAGYDEGLFNMTCRGFMLYAPSFLIMGINIWASSFFTALGNGAVSAAISCLRTFVFQLVYVMVLPVFFGQDGIWTSIVWAELSAVVFTVIFFVKYRNKYKYA